MDNRKRAAWAEVSIDNLAYNIGTIRDAVGNKAKVCGVLKADAYGHGLMGTRKSLAERGLVEMFAVGKISELTQLSSEEWGDDLETLLLGAAQRDEVEEAIAEKLIDPDRCIFSVYGMKQFWDFKEIAGKYSVKIRVHIRVDGWDSGMGFSYKDFLENQENFLNSEDVVVCGLYSHLYTSYSEIGGGIKDELRRFDELVKGMDQSLRRRLTVHVLNSAILYAYPQYAYDMVRAGTALYGLPYDTPVELKPALKICATVFDVREIDSDVPLFYVRSDQSGKRRIARIMLGYWDCPLLLTQKDISIKIRDRVFKPADDICMDNLCIDITGAEDIEVGDVAVIMGEEGVTISEIMERTGVTPSRSEWLCMTAGRLEKIYL
jgi:alanine racemase